MTVKEKIQSCFNNAASTYDKVSTVQDEINQQLIDFLIPYGSQYDCIVDLACGTGNSSLMLANQFEMQRLIGVDFCQELLSIAKDKLSNKSIKFKLMDFDCLDLDDQSVDLLFSNMGLQWSLDFNKTLNHFYKKLKPGGYLAFALPVEGNFPELKSEHKNTLLAIDKIKLLLNNKFDVQLIKTKEYRQAFNNYKSAISNIKQLGANAKLNPSNQTQKTKKTYQDLFKPNTPSCLTYKIGFFIARRN